ncbi:hypothetical protein HU200_035103 [Digitaria exilis]|uniref:Uncharacterized protein n=1 Tax=Digitaria exilis TaxID=1010633 RepID=A0A835BH29_9POAL|nr:hypothetical protein HU200_035103 [Digitaria exilis]CAB3495545.1 unnamed protein product [Digitaria exilis]
MFASVIVEETVKQIILGCLAADSRGEKRDGVEHVERLEMAQIRLEAALETSVRWPIRDASLLRWRRKLKRAAEECDDALHRCKQRIVEDQEASSSSSFPRRLARATKSYFSSLVAGGGDAVDARRFEWFADSASDFVRYVELGGTARRYMFFDPLIGQLLAGNELRYRLVRGTQYHLLCMRPASFEGRGLEAKMFYVYEDDDAPEKNFCLGLMLRLSESMDVVGVTIKCLQLVTPHFRSTAEAAMREFAQLPTQDFSWVPYVESSDKEHWDNVHGTMSQLLRPNPRCCRRGRHEAKPFGSSNANTTTAVLDVFLEPVIEVYFQRIIPLSKQHERRRTVVVQGEAVSTTKLDFPHLKLGIVFSPHRIPEDMTPAVTGTSTVEFIDGKQQDVMHKNISLEQLDEIMLPKAIDCLYKKAEAMLYQLFWKSNHETAYLLLEKKGVEKMPRGIIDDDLRDRIIQRRKDPKLERWLQVFTDFLKTWVALPLAPDSVHGQILEWIKKSDEM